MSKKSLFQAVKGFRKVQKEELETKLLNGITIYGDKEIVEIPKAAVEAYPSM